MRFEIVDKSMEPIFKPGDYVIINKLSYFFTEPKKGDVIILKHPKEKDKFLLKRISLITDKGYYVIGDNKDFSQDSRHFGPINKNAIIGKVLFHIRK